VITYVRCSVAIPSAAAAAAWNFIYRTVSLESKTHDHCNQTVGGVAPGFILQPCPNLAGRFCGEGWLARVLECDLSSARAR
jgi:hypothetical protein